MYLIHDWGCWNKILPFWIWDVRPEQESFLGSQVSRQQHGPNSWCQGFQIYGYGSLSGPCDNWASPYLETMVKSCIFSFFHLQLMSSQVRKKVSVFGHHLLNNFHSSLSDVISSPWQTPWMLQYICPAIWNKFEKAGWDQSKQIRVCGARNKGMIRGGPRISRSQWCRKRWGRARPHCRSH